MQAAVFRGILRQNLVASKSAAPYVFLFAEPQQLPDALGNGKETYFILVHASDVSLTLQEHVVVEGKMEKVDDSCHMQVPVYRLNHIALIEHPEDWDEECPDFLPFFCNLARASCEFACWEAWALGLSVFGMRDGELIETFPDGTERICSE